VADILERVGTTAEAWQARLEKLSKGRLLGRFFAATMLTPRTVGPAETNHWLAVTVALAHVSDAITPPSMACRLGGYKLMFFGPQLMPEDPSHFAERYGCFERYRDCLCRTVQRLESQGLYDQRVESAVETAELARSRFGWTHPAASL
jgi:hypothetical protein